METALRNYSGVERAAVLMMLVGEEEAAAILQKLEPEEVRKLGSAMFAVADVREDEVETVLDDFVAKARERSEEHTSELQSLMRISYAVFCLKKKKNTINKKNTTDKHNQHNQAMSNKV